MVNESLRNGTLDSVIPAGPMGNKERRQAERAAERTMSDLYEVYGPSSFGFGGIDARWHRWKQGFGPKPTSAELKLRRDVIHRKEPKKGRRAGLKDVFVRQPTPREQQHVSVEGAKLDKVLPDES